MRIFKKNSNKVKVKTKIDNYIEDFDSKLTWENEIDLKIDNILNDYNSAKALVVKIEDRNWLKKELDKLLEKSIKRKSISL